MQPQPPSPEPSLLLKLYRWSRQHQGLAWAWVGGVMVIGVVFVAIPVVVMITQIKSADTQKTIRVDNTTPMPEKKPVKEVDYTWKGFKYGVGISSLTRTKDRVPPGYEKVNVTLQISNRQTDRTARGPLLHYGVAIALRPDSWRDELTLKPSDCSPAMIKKDPANCNILTIQNPNDYGRRDSGGEIPIGGVIEHDFDFEVKEGTPDSDFIIWLDTAGSAFVQGQALPLPE
jgi:hypothetical protein